MRTTHTEALTRSSLLLALAIWSLASRPIHAQTMPMPMSMPAMPPNPLGVTMDRMGSGTTWVPDAAPIPARRTSLGDWDITGHGFVFVQEDHQFGARGGNQFGSLNWGMLMASHELAGGRFQARTMLSLDALTVTPRGYPLLLQSGESYHGQPLHDRQHPHDFFMELGVLYERAMTKSLGVSLYAAPSGEPALGPVAFMHRPSAMDIPTAPIGHHWQDATHITFGVVSAGIFTHTLKIEASTFNGREPDEDRWDIDPIRLDSYSGRITFNPTSEWSFTTGYGFIHSPEAMHPDESLHRVTASALHGTRLGSEGQWTTALIWGVNRMAGQSAAHSGLLESELVFDSRNTIMGRAEFVQKSAEDLSLDSVGGPNASTFGVTALSLGYIRELSTWRGATMGLGGMGTVNFVPQQLRQSYGSRTPAALMVFLRVRPSGVGGAMANMAGMKM